MNMKKYLLYLLFILLPSLLFCQSGGQGISNFTATAGTAPSWTPSTTEASQFAYNYGQEELWQYTASAWSRINMGKRVIADSYLNTDISSTVLVNHWKIYDHVFFYVKTSSAASSTSQILLPSASATYNGKQITVVSVDSSGTYGTEFSAAGVEIYKKGVAQANPLNLSNYTTTTLVCVKTDAGVYFWNSIDDIDNSGDDVSAFPNGVTITPAEKFVTPDSLYTVQKLIDLMQDSAQVKTANNGLSLSGTTIQLGNAVGGSSAALTGNREIPTGGNDIVVSGAGNTFFGNRSDPTGLGSQGKINLHGANGLTIPGIRQTSHLNNLTSGYFHHYSFNPDSLSKRVLTDSKYGKFGSFDIITSWDNSINSGTPNGDTTGNMITNIGVNLVDYNAKRPKSYLSFERGYVTPSETHNSVEGHWEVLDTLGNTIRPVSWQAFYDGSFVQIGFAGDQTNFTKSPAQKLLTPGTDNWESANFVTGVFTHNNQWRNTITIASTNPIIEKKETGGGGSIRNVITLNSQNRVLVGDSAGVILYNRIRMQTNNANNTIVSSSGEIRFDSTLLKITNSIDYQLSFNKFGSSGEYRAGYNGTTFSIGESSFPSQVLINKTAPDYSISVGSAGKVGIGILTPVYTLDVVGTDAIRMPSGTTAQRPTNSTGLIRYNTSNSYLEHSQGGSAWWRILSENPTGTVGTANQYGIGSNTTINLWSETTEIADMGATLGFGSKGKATGQPTFLHAIIKAGKEGAGVDYAGYLAFRTVASNSTENERVRITSTGLFGIGTNLPLSILHLKSSSANTTSVIQLENTTVTTPLKMFATNATPESAITGSPGDIALSNAGKAYIKASGSATNTGWLELTTSAGSGIYGGSGTIFPAAAATVTASSTFNIRYSNAQNAINVDDNLTQMILSSRDGATFLKFSNGSAPITQVSSASSSIYGALFLGDKTGTPVPGDAISIGLFRDNGIGVQKEYARIKASVVDTTNTSEDGELSFHTYTAGTLTQKAVITELGYLGIGTTTPAALLSLGLAGTTKGVMNMAGNTSGLVTIQPAAAAGTWTLTLPTNDGDANQVLKTDGSGITSWTTVSAGTGDVISLSTTTDNAMTRYHGTSGDTIQNSVLIVDDSGNIIGPTAGFKITGGTATTADLSFQTTSGVGASGADIHFLVGNNGATEAVTILNNGNLIANKQDANVVTIGSVTGTTNYPGIWFGSAAISLSNFAFLADVGSSTTILNAPTGGTLSFRVNNGAIMTALSTGNVGIGTSSPPVKLSTLGTTAQFGIYYDLSNGHKFTESATNALTITPLVNSTTSFNVTNAAASTIFNVDATNSRIGFGTATPSYSFHSTLPAAGGAVFGVVPSAMSNGDVGYYFAGPTVTGYYNLMLMRGNATTGTVAEFENTNNTSSAANAQFRLEVGGTSAGDPFLYYLIPGATEFSMGLDNSDSDKFRMGFQQDPSSATGSIVITTGGLVGIGTSPSTNLSFSGETDQTIAMERHTGASVGKDISIRAGGAKVGNTDNNGGSVVIRSGISTGSGSSDIYFQTVTAGASGTTDRTATTKMIVRGSGNVGIGTEAPTNNLSFGGESAQTISVEQPTTGNGAALLIKAGDAKTGETDKVGGAFTIYAGRGTGAGSGGDISFQTATAGGTGSSFNSLSTKFAILQNGKIDVRGTNPTIGTINATTPLHFETNGTRRFSIPSSGIATAPASTKALVLSSTDSLGYREMASGTYYPTVAMTSGTDTILNTYASHYSRNDSIITVHGKCKIGWETATTLTSFTITLPVASAFTDDNNDASGTVTISQTEQGVDLGTASSQVRISAENTTDKLIVNVQPMGSTVVGYKRRNYISWSVSYKVK